jgi:4-hydroxy-L-threonine phosphate dehydrogenase PdxA
LPLPVRALLFLGLNPHAGDNGLLGKEENDIILPAIIEAKKEGIIALGPYAADGFFGSEDYRKFDAILAMYHDQGLVPFKLASFERGVNYTAGLPVIRTSPAHGTAFALAGEGKASPIRSGRRCTLPSIYSKTGKFMKKFLKTL